MTQSCPTRCPTLTGLIATLFSGLTTATTYSSLNLGHGPLGDDQGILLDPHLCTDPAELPGPEDILRVRKERGHPDGTGPHIHLAVRKG